MSVNPALATLSGLGAEAEEKLVGFNWLENSHTVRCGLADYIKKWSWREPFELQDFPLPHIGATRANIFISEGFRYAERMAG